MPSVCLRDAAQQVGVSKSTLLRAIHAGRMMAQRTDDGGYVVEEAELQRVYPAGAETVAARGETLPARVEADQGVAEKIELMIRNAQLEAELSALKSLLEAERRRGEELREERDRWFRQADRLPLPAPVQALKPVPAQSTPIGDVMGRLFRRSA